MHRTLTILAVAALLASCDADSEYSSWPCRFSYDNSLHLDATLGAALDVNSPGTFCAVSEQTQAGVKWIVFENNKRQTSRLPETREEMLAQFILGLNNGIIVGFQSGVRDNFGNAAFTAYDIQCPNCVRDEQNTISPNYRVTMTDSGIATCPRCLRRYDLNFGGQLQNAQKNDVSLQKYVAMTSGRNGHVSVFRRR